MLNNLQTCSQLHCYTETDGTVHFAVFSHRSPMLTKDSVPKRTQYQSLHSDWCQTQFHVKKTLCNYSGIKTNSTPFTDLGGSLPWSHVSARLIQSTHPLPLGCILILSFHLCLCLLSSLSYYRTSQIKFYMHISSLPSMLHASHIWLSWSGLELTSVIQEDLSIKGISFHKTSTYCMTTSRKYYLYLCHL